MLVLILDILFARRGAAGEDRLSSLTAKTGFDRTDDDLLHFLFTSSINRRCCDGFQLLISRCKRYYCDSISA
jgi:hypothetical protein